MEKRLMKGRNKYILLIFYLVFWITGIIMIEIDIASNLVMIAIIITIYIPFAYLYVALLSEGDVRKKILYVFMVFVILMVASLLTGEMVIDSIAQPLGITRIDVHVAAYFIKMICLLFLFVGFK